MKIKNINALERHVEKALVIVAVLFVAWRCYWNLVQDPNAVPLPGGMAVTVPPGGVGQKINFAVTTLKASIKSAERSAVTQRGIIPDYDGIYINSQRQPLADTLIQLPTFPFGPLNQRLPTTTNPIEKTVVFKVPHAPRLIGLKAVQGHGLATDTPQPEDINWVELKAFFPLALWHKSMAGGGQLTANEAPLPQSYQHTTFYRVQVRRQQRLASGLWGVWSVVKGTYLQPLPQVDLSHATPGQVARALGILDQSQSQILTPAFHTLAAQRHLVAPVNQPRVPVVRPRGPGAVPQFPPQFRPPGGAFNNGPTGARAAQTAMARMIRSRQMRMQQQRQNNFSNNNFVPGLPPAGVGAPGVVGETADIPMNFYDQTAVPGKEYRYKMRVVLYNPVFEFPYNLTDPAAKAKPWLRSPWSKLTKPIKIRQSEYFFLVSSQLDSRGRASFRIFKWVQNVWTVADEWVAPGQGIGNTQQVPLMNNTTGNLENSSVNFATGYTLVEAKENSAGSSLIIIIKHPNGALSLRTSAWDAVNPEQNRLNSRVAQTGIVPIPAGLGTPIP